MKRIIIIIALAVLGKLASAQYQPVKEGSTVQFTIKNFGFNVSGSFTGLTGVVRFDSQNPGSASFDVSLDAASVNTDNNMRDDHLRRPSYFDAEKYPRIRLVSGKVTTTGKNGVYLFTGKLTIKDHTKDVSFPFTSESVGGGYRFKGGFTINRKDFDVGGTSTISDKLEVALDVIVK
jgi:polyisoprenoid-binding protein YceI